MPKTLRIFLAVMTLMSLSRCSESDPPVDPGVPWEVTLRRLEPSSGLAGTEVLLHGSGFEPSPITIYFGAEQANILVSTAETIFMTAPSASIPGPVDIKLVNGEGQEITFPEAFTYLAAAGCSVVPEIESIDPDIAPNNATILIQGKNFVVGSNASVVTIGAVQADVVGDFNSSLITVSVPDLSSICNQPTCAVELAVTNPDGCRAVSKNLFTYQRVDQNDRDGDGLTNDQELIVYLTNPEDPDTDNDLLTDGQEVKIYCSDPLRTDSTIRDVNDNIVASANNGILDGHEHPVRSDVDRTGRVDGFDLAIVGRNFGASTTTPGVPPEADINLDGIVNQPDVDIMEIYFGMGFCARK